MKPANFKKIKELMEEREKLIVLQDKFKSCKSLAVDNSPDENPEIRLSVNVDGGPYTDTLQEDYGHAMAFVINYITNLQQRINMINAQLKPL